MFQVRMRFWEHRVNFCRTVMDHISRFLLVLNLLSLATIKVPLIFRICFPVKEINNIQSL